jgi:hypothetical protein
MAEKSSRTRGRGGRPNLGDRVGQTIRFPKNAHEEIERDLEGTGVTFNDYVVATVLNARRDGTALPLRRPTELPLAM